MSEKIKVMTFNLRVEAAIDGINELKYRKNRILKTIADENPDLIGFQEARDETRAWLRDSLGNYILVGCGRCEDYRGESAPLAFRKDKFEMVSMDSFWLSNTPKIPASRYDGSDQSICPRIVTAVTLKPTNSDRVLLFVNAHTDHQGVTSRILASAQLLEYMSQKAMPTVLTGDFNATPDTQEIKMLVSNSNFPLTDATANIESTFHDFGKRLTGERYIGKPGELKALKIDYVFTNLNTDPKESYAVRDIPIDGVYISDHQVVVAFVEI